MGRPLFQSFLLGGFECSTQRLRSGKRLNLLTATQHHEYRLIVADYRRLQQHGIFTVRSGIHWPAIETRPYCYDFSSVRPFLQAAQETNMQVIWDICHFGWPDDIDIFAPEFIHRLRRFAAAFAWLLLNETEAQPFLVPINEISFLSWAGGDRGILNPFQRRRGPELKLQLVKASIEVIEAIWEVLPQARLVQVEPVIHIATNPKFRRQQEQTERYRLAQYEVWDMLAGRLFPHLGGQEKYLDIIGLNYYSKNQWLHKGPHLAPGDLFYKPFRNILREVYLRYQRPLFVAETGAEDEVRPNWFRYVAEEVYAALQKGIPVEGICLYPILNHPGWDDDRHCHNGLWDYLDEQGERQIYEPLAGEVKRQQQIFQQWQQQQLVSTQHRNGSDPRGVKTASRLTLCLFTDSLEPSGMGEHMLALAAILLDHHQILFVCPPTPKGVRLLNQASALGCLVLALDLRHAEQGYARLGAWLGELQVQVFHCHAGIGWEGHEGIRTARRHNVPVVVRTEHLPYLLTDSRQKRDYQRLLPLIDQLICVSEAAYATYQAASVPAEKLTIVRNGIQPPVVTVDRTEVRRSLGLPNEAQIVLTVARLTEQKGHRYLVEAMPTILQAAPQVYFVWAGDGPLEAKLRHQLEELAIPAERVIFGGWRNDVLQLLAAADLFVLPSLFEGLPLVVLEALAVGIPVIGTRVCGTSEAIEDGVSGCLVEPANSQQLATAISTALTQPAQAAHWRNAGRRRFEKLFNAERMTQETVALYRRLLWRQQHYRPAPFGEKLPTCAPELLAGSTVARKAGL